MKTSVHAVLHQVPRHHPIKYVPYLVNFHFGSFQIRNDLHPSNFQILRRPLDFGTQLAHVRKYLFFHVQRVLPELIHHEGLRFDDGMQQGGLLLPAFVLAFLYVDCVLLAAAFVHQSILHERIRDGVAAVVKELVFVDGLQRVRKEHARSGGTEHETFGDLHFLQPVQQDVPCGLPFAAGQIESSHDFRSSLGLPCNEIVVHLDA
mmetsp:Transcript_4027/g.11388  ORF Transcript_4027/g.11388 Transcript_4027/m.11388 type:complete len:205 (+) Transcript_4027:1164-1778(+)